MADTKKAPPKSSDDDDVLEESRKLFEVCSDAEDYNRQNYEDDMRFYQGGPNQWPPEVLASRQADGKPTLTINHIPAFCKQVTNDARQNKPSIKVHPADSGADPETADIIQELIRNIEVTSDADIAYDTAGENAVRAGWGYFKVDLAPAYNDVVDLDIKIRRVANTLSIYGDPFSTEADSSDWMDAFDVERIPKAVFDKEWKGKSAVDWSSDVWNSMSSDWITADMVMVARRWKREPIKKPVVVMSDGTVIEPDKLNEIDEELGLPLGKMFEMMGITVKRQAEVSSFKVTRYTMTGAEVLETHDWPGCYIPIVPVYGNEVWVDGKRYLTSLFHDAKDQQMNHNIWESTATEVVALAPKTPFIGEEGAFDADIDKWATANTRNHAFLEYSKGMQMPQRQPFVSVPAGVIDQAIRSLDSMKAIMGLYDASLGQRSNETSGVAINARKREGDVSTFNFQDNVSRGIRCLGRIVLDLIPKVYQGERMIRVMGEDNKARNVQLGKPTPVLDKKTGQPQEDPQKPGMPLTRIYDLTAGKYDLTVETGPSFTTRREEAAAGMTELIRAFPPAAPIVGPQLVRNLDWPGAEDIAEGLEAMAPKPGGLPPEVQQMIEDGKKQIGDLTQERDQLKQQNLQLDANSTISQAKEQLANIKLQTATAGPQAEPAADPIILETERLKKETARLTALGAYITAETKLVDIQNPPQETPPDPLEQESKKITAHAGHTKAQADFINAQAALHSAQNPVDKEGKPIKPLPKPGPKNTRRMIKKIHRGPDGSIAGADIVDEELQ